MTTLAASITLRPGYADDELALARLAALDGADAVPSSPLLLAEVDGQLRAALSLYDGTAIADPFFPSAHLLALLGTHLSAAPAVRRRRRRPVPREPAGGRARADARTRYPRS